VIGPTSINSGRAQLGSFVSLVADASVTLLSERVHRGSLANARHALAAQHPAADPGLQATLREIEARTRRARPLPLTGTSR
jgi:hypothetical protein